MAPTESLSSCGPQAKGRPPPPMAQAPTPIGVICKSLFPSFLVCMWSVLVNHNGTFGEAPLKVIPQVHKPHPAGLRAVGMRLTFRQPPPIDCRSNQFLFFPNRRLAGRRL